MLVVLVSPTFWLSGEVVVAVTTAAAGVPVVTCT
jgi:hypothetical protein